ncbi:MAG: hypothetical protein ABJK25_15895 [Halieaceae bacterium]
MNWDAIGAMGELLGALVVVVTLAYLAVQVRHAKAATADQSRLYRATAAREIILETCRDDALRMLQIKSWDMEPYYESLAEKLSVTIEEASKLDWGNAYYFWMWWGQWASTTESSDMKEIEHVVAVLGGLPAMREHWETSPVSRPVLDTDFVKFVDELYSKASR